MIRTLNNPIMCLHGPQFLIAWNIHTSCNLLCAHGIATHGTIDVEYIRMEWPCAQKPCYEKCVGTHVQLTCISLASTLQKHVEFIVKATHV